MQYKVFISHSNDANDLAVVNQIKAALTNNGFVPIIAEEQIPTTSPTLLSEKITKLIDNADFCVALLTENGVGSAYVNQEVGYIIKSKKALIPLVSKGIPSQKLSLLQGAEYIQIEEDFAKTIKNLLAWLEKIKGSKSSKDLQQFLGIVALIGISVLAGTYILTHYKK